MDILRRLFVPQKTAPQPTDHTTYCFKKYFWHVYDSADPLELRLQSYKVVKCVKNKDKCRNY